MEALLVRASHTTHHCSNITPGTDKTMTNLISRVVCVGRLEFQSSGYNGPLERSLLSFAWMITALRTCLRDLMETVLVCMLMNGDVVRDRKDWAELSHL